MSNALVELTNKLAARLDMGSNGAELFNTLKATAFKGQVTDAQMTALLIVANQYQLNPWTKEIYAFPDKQNGIVPVVGVDGWSRIINDNPQFDGMDFRRSDSMVTMNGAKSAAPEWMECIIYRKDRAHPTVVREYLDEVYRAPFKKSDGYQIDGPWQTHPKRFLRHKAMIQCSRIAFGYTGIYDQDEAERITEKDMGAVTRVVDTEAALTEIGSCQTPDELAAIWKRLAKECNDAKDKAAYDAIKNAVATTGAALKAAVVEVDQEDAA